MEKWIQCKHKGYVLNIIVPATSNKYKFHFGRPNLVKNDEDIKYFLDDGNYEEVKAPKVVHPKVEKIDTPSPAQSEENKVPEEVKPTSGEEEHPDESQDDPEKSEKKIYSKNELKKLDKGKLREILATLTTKDSPKQKANVINLIIECQGSK